MADPLSTTRPVQQRGSNVHVEIRAAVPEDAKAVRALVEVVLPATYDLLHPDYAARELATWELDTLPVKIAEGVYVVAEANGRIIGLASAAIDERDRFVMNTLHVHPDHQGVRLGSRMLTEVAFLLEGQPLWTRYPEGDDNAAAFCERHGFEVAEKVDDPPFGTQVWVRREPV